MEQQIYLQSDLAKECLPESRTRFAGMEETTRKIGNFTRTCVQIKSEEAAKEIGKPMGSYLTLESERFDLLGREEQELLSHILCGEIRGFTERVCGKRPDASFSVLIVGLGNPALTADAVGPLTLQNISATAHLKTRDPELYQTLNCCAVSTMTPGVLGQSGMEAGEVVCAVAKRIKPDLVIAVDALAARDMERLATTVQLSDTGMIPGSGVGNHRMGITKETLGIPVLALGVPTVVSSSTLVYHSLAKAGVSEPNLQLKRLLETGADYFVSLKECDQIIQKISLIFARALSLAFLGILAD